MSGMSLQAFQFYFMTPIWHYNIPNKIITWIKDLLTDSELRVVASGMISSVVCCKIQSYEE